MERLLFLLAVVSLLFGHLFKIYRWKQFVEVYEKPDFNNLTASLVVGYLINFVVPFRLGDVLRGWISGKKMKNGKALSFASIVVDRYLDVISVGLIFFVLSCIHLENADIKNTSQFYIVFSIVLIILSIVFVKYSKFPKFIVGKIAGIFNENIKLKILRFSWALISNFKDIWKNISVFKLLGNTICMWFFYIISYICIGMYFECSYEKFSVSEVFLMLFSKTSLDTPTYWIRTDIPIVMVCYMIIPLIILLLLSLLGGREKKNYISEQEHYINLLPHVREKDRLDFLDSYFFGDREYFEKYLELNRDINILEDYSAGSNATTMLCMGEEGTFYRKYAFGLDGDKLYEQVCWLQAHKNYIPLCEIRNIKRTDGCCSYDMPYYSNAIGLFNYIHSVPFDRGWDIIRCTLDTLNTSLYQLNKRCADANTIEKYIDTKVEKNIDIIKNSKYIKPLMQYDYIYINGVKYNNFPLLESYLKKERLKCIFERDEYTDIHGDLTIENIICIQNGGDKDEFYIIDPNTGNLHDSPFLDYGKLLQSLHGGYEFLMKTQNVEIQDNHIHFLFTKSQAYSEMLKRLKEYLYNTFEDYQIKSVFYHEIIHWLRLMPYKIQKNGKRSLIFYAGMIMVMNDVINEFEEDKG